MKINGKCIAKKTNGKTTRRFAKRNSRNEYNVIIYVIWLFLLPERVHNGQRTFLFSISVQTIQPTEWCLWIMPRHLHWYQQRKDVERNTHCSALIGRQPTAFYGFFPLFSPRNEFVFNIYSDQRFKWWDSPFTSQWMEGNLISELLARRLYLHLRCTVILINLINLLTYSLETGQKPPWKPGFVFNNCVYVFNKFNKMRSS